MPTSNSTELPCHMLGSIGARRCSTGRVGEQADHYKCVAKHGCQQGRANYDVIFLLMEDFGQRGSGESTAARATPDATSIAIQMPHGHWSSRFVAAFETKEKSINITANAERGYD